LKNALAYYNAGVVAANLKVVGLGPGMTWHDTNFPVRVKSPLTTMMIAGLKLQLTNIHRALLFCTFTL
jgi:hypothetical protein